MILLSVTRPRIQHLKKNDKELPDPSLIWAMSGLPSINIPSFQKNGMPYGFQIVSKKYNDYQIFNLLKKFENLDISPRTSMIPNIIRKLLN